MAAHMPQPGEQHPQRPQPEGKGHAEEGTVAAGAVAHLWGARWVDGKATAANLRARDDIRVTTPYPFRHRERGVCFSSVYSAHSV